MTHSTLTTTLHELRRRLLAIETGAGAVWTSITVLVSLLAWMWLDVILELSAGLRVVAWLLAALLAAAVICFIKRSAGRRCEVRSLARRLDAGAGAGGQILTGVELMTELQAGTNASGDPRLAGALTVGLAEMAVDRAAALASTVSAVQAAPSRPLHRPSWVFALLIVGIGAVAILAPRLAKTQWLRFVDPFGDHPAYSRVWFDVRPGSTRVIYGEGLDITVRPHGGTPERIDLVLQASDAGGIETLPMFPESGGSWRATIASLTKPHRYHVRAARARSHQYDIGIQTVPRLEMVRFKVTPPAYSRKAGYDGELPAGGLVGLPRTRIQIWAKSNRPLSGGRVDFMMPSTAPATAPAGEAAIAAHAPATSPASAASTVSMERTAAPNEVTGTVTLNASGRLVIQIVDVDGQASRQAFTAPVMLVPDERPFIRLLAPPAESLATPTAIVPVSLAAEDDCGISRVQLFRSLNDSRPLPMDVLLPGVAPARWSETVELRLASYGLQPGDEIKLFARVEDNDPDGAKGSESTIATVRIIAQADYERLVGIQAGIETMLAKYQQADRRVESLLAEIEKLQKELEALPRDSELGEAQRKKLESLMDQLKEASEAIQEAAQAKLPYDLDRKLNPKLEELARKLAEAMGELEPAASKPGLSAAQAMEALKKAAGKCGGGRKDFDTEVTEPLEHLAAIYPLIEDQARFVALYERQRELATRLAAMKDHEQESDPAAKARMRDLEAEQKQLHDAFDDLLSDIEDHVAKLPEDEKLDELRDTATKFVEDVRDSRSLLAMSEAQSALAEFSGARAYQRAAEAADAMSKFIGRCQGMGQSGEMCLKFQPQLSSGMGNTVEQLLSEAGLPSMGQQGTGGGSGYSAQRTTLQNVGMYGGLSRMANTPRGGSLRGRLIHTTEAGRESSDRHSEPPGGNPDTGSTAAGTNQSVVPVKYRNKVGQYFERIADEEPDHRPAR